MSVAFEVRMDRDVSCASCTKTILTGAKAFTAAGKFWHINCPVPPQKVLFPGTSEAPQEGTFRTAADSRIFVQIAVWIPIDNLAPILAAIKEARR